MVRPRRRLERGEVGGCDTGNGLRPSKAVIRQINLNLGIKIDLGISTVASGRRVGP